MGKAGRFACVFIPMALTIASLVCLVFVFLAQRDRNNSTTSSLYFFRADTSNFSTTANVDLSSKTTLDNTLLNGISSLKSTGNISDFYQVGLWDYCSGTKSGSSNATFNITFCSSPEQFYFFNVTEVWGLSGSEANLLPKALNDGMNAYAKAAHWMFIAYAVALGVTALEIVVGFFAIFSRWGSCVTTIVSSASSLFTILAAITSTALSAILVGDIEVTLGAYGIKGSLGTRMLVVVWLAVAFSLGAGLFWTFSTCCCSGKSGYKRDGGIRRQGTAVERLPYSHQYKHLGEVHQSGQQMGVPMGNVGHMREQNAAYEPYRTV